jgi:hypothetical protein
VTLAANVKELVDKLKTAADASKAAPTDAKLKTDYETALNDTFVAARTLKNVRITDVH